MKIRHERISDVFLKELDEIKRLKYANGTWKKRKNLSYSIITCKIPKVNDDWNIVKKRLIDAEFKEEHEHE